MAEPVSLNEVMASFYGRMPRTKQNMRGGSLPTGDEIVSRLPVGQTTDYYDQPRSLAGCSRTVVVRGKARRLSCRRGT